MTDPALRLFERARLILAEQELRPFDHEAARERRWFVSQDVYDEMAAVASAWSDGVFTPGETRLFGYLFDADPALPPLSITFRPR